MPERGAKSSAIDFAVKTFDYLVEFESPAGIIQGLELGLKLELCSLTNRV